MNLLLLAQDEIDENGLARIGGRRARHILQVLKSQPGNLLKSGVINGPLGAARMETVSAEDLTLKFTAEREPPAPLPIRLVLAMPRPKALRRLLADIAALGVKEIHLVHAAKVEKAYWHSEHLSEAAIAQAFRLGLEQGGDTLMPRVQLERRFKPFVEDRLPALINGQRALVAHPGGGSFAPAPGPQTLAIGPEGGFTTYEIGMLEAAGFQTVNLGTRILRTETALTCLLAKATL